MRMMGREFQRLLDASMAELAGVPTLLLMEHAAMQTAQVCRELLAERAEQLPVAILTGLGNNGGDGYALARLLHADGIDVTVYECLRAGETLPGADSALNRRAAEALQIKLRPLSDFVSKPCMVVDCIFGTGFRAERALPDECKAVFKQVDYIRRTYRTPVVAVDIPSGVDADTALVAEGALQATHTVTFVAPKPGLLGYPGRKFAGEIAVRGLGIPESFAAAVFQNSGLQGTYAITEADLRAWRPERPADGHKGLFGRALLLAGNTGMMGAGVMAAEACLQSGTGLVTWAVPEDVYPIAATFCPQALVTPLPNDFSNRVVACKELIFNKQAVLIGPGCGTDELTVLSLEQAIRNAARLVIDADGLNCLAKDPDLQAEVAARRARLLEPAVLTPHPGEFVRLIPEQAGFPDGRVAAAEALAERLNCVVVLKGAGTVVALPSILETKERFWVNITGNSGLSKGGSGDVLAGLMTGLLAQNLPLGVAVCGAVYLHGLAGDQLKETCGERALRPTDLPAALAGAFAACGW